jgi:DNA-directed RNA polymerase subunit RPC12/RpoP
MSYELIALGVVTYTCDRCGRQETQHFEHDPFEHDPWDLDSYPDGWTYTEDDDGTILCDRCKSRRAA